MLLGARVSPNKRENMQLAPSLLPFSAWKEVVVSTEAVATLKPCGEAKHRCAKMASGLVSLMMELTRATYFWTSAEIKTNFLLLFFLCVSLCSLGFLLLAAKCILSCYRSDFFFFLVDN